MNIRKNLIDSSRYSLKCPYSMKVEYVTYHNTDNNASADAEVRNVKRPDNNAQVSFHVAVDEKEAVQVIPFNRNAFAAGDGKDGTGNRKSIHVEICRNELGANNPTFKKCEDNAVEVCAQLLKENGLGIDRLKPHKYWSGKNCPSTTNHKNFERRVKDKLEQLNKPQVIKYKNCVLYGNDIDKVAAEVIGWAKDDCIVKHIDNHIKWEGSNLFIVGGSAEKKMNDLNNGENYSVIKGEDRYDTIKKCLSFIGK